MIRLRHPGPQDAGLLARILDEVNAHYRIAPLSAEERGVQVSRMLTGGHVSVLLAEEEGRARGIAVYTFLDPAGGPGPSLYLKELYVSPASRGAGLGRRMMARLAGIAAARGCTRMDWTTERWNEGAMRFYAALGAEEQPQKVYFRLPAARFDSLGEE